MTAAAILPHLQRWANVITELDDAMSALDKVLGSCPESRLRQAIWAACGLANEWAATQCDTTADWLEWYWLENRMGQRGHEAGSYATWRPIRTLEDFATLLAEDAPGAKAE